jgi:16S rRNA C1402 N4-methylase RsmH
MPVTKQFIFNSSKFQRRKKTTIQHKLRVVMNCYTVSEFQLDETNNTFSFKKNYRINGLRLEDKKVLTGNYLLEEINDEECKITITVNT